jgi:hypothetical protein
MGWPPARQYPRMKPNKTEIAPRVESVSLNGNSETNVAAGVALVLRLPFLGFSESDRSPSISLDNLALVVARLASLF